MPSAETFEAFRSDEFLTGLAFGFAALAVGVLAIFLWRQWRTEVAAIVGLLMAGAAAGAARLTVDPPTDVFAGIVLLAVGGAFYPWARAIPLLPALLAAPGAWWITQEVESPGADWVSWLLFAWVVLGSVAVASFDRHHRASGYGPILVVVAVAGMFATLPDTEQILVVLGATLPLAVLAWPRGVAALGAMGIYPLVGLLAWVIAVGGLGRESSIIGAVASLGLLAAEPMARWWRGATAIDLLPPRWWRVPAVALAQVVVVLLVARVAGLAGSATTAVVIALALLVSTLLALVAFAARLRPGC